MKKITMFMLEKCPYCIAAKSWMDELMSENETYRKLEIEFIDERKNPEIANKHDYFYVPAYFSEGKKLHEGAASLEIVKGVFDAVAAQPEK